jgi:signal peptidase I
MSGNRLTSHALVLLVLLALILAALVAVIRQDYIVLRVSEDSMRPGICAGDLLIVSVKNGPAGQAYENLIGERLVFSTREGRLAVKRLYGAPGGRVSYSMSRIEGSEYSSDSTLVCRSRTDNEAEAIEEDLGADELFVAGDNLTKSTDSRTFGPIPAKSVVGVVTRVIPARFSDCGCPAGNSD